jgi:hypothetical protein
MPLLAKSLTCFATMEKVVMAGFLGLEAMEKGNNLLAKSQQLEQTPQGEKKQLKTRLKDLIKQRAVLGVVPVDKDVFAGLLDREIYRAPRKTQTAPPNAQLSSVKSTPSLHTGSAPS